MSYGRFGQISIGYEPTYNGAHTQMSASNIASTYNGLSIAYNGAYGGYKSDAQAAAEHAEIMGDQPDGSGKGLFKILTNVLLPEGGKNLEVPSGLQGEPNTPKWWWRKKRKDAWAAAQAAASNDIVAQQEAAVAVKQSETVKYVVGGIFALGALFVLSQRR